MDDNIKMICTVTHGDYIKGNIYPCIYTCYQTMADEDYKIYKKDDDYNYADIGKKGCDLNYFKKMDCFIELNLIEKTFLSKLVFKIFRIKLNRTYIKKKLFLREYKNKDIRDFINEAILAPIEQIYEHESFYLYQEKVVYILTQLNKINNFKEYIDIENRISNYKEIINKIAMNIQVLDDEGKEESDKISVERINIFIKQEDKLLKRWNEGLDNVGL